jgi:hypothetical protein
MLAPGMNLAEDVVTSTGQLLLKKGHALAFNHIRLFKQWGIEEIKIAGENPQDEPHRPIPPEILQKAEDMVARKFRLNPPDLPAVQMVRVYCVQKTAERLHNQPSSHT